METFARGVDKITRKQERGRELAGGSLSAVNFQVSEIAAQLELCARQERKGSRRLARAKINAFTSLAAKLLSQW